MKLSSKTIRVQIFLALLTVALVMAAIFSPYGCYTNVHSIRQSIDERLKTAVYGVREIIPIDYHDRLKSGKVGKDEYAKLQARINDYAKKINVTFLYALVKDDNGKIRFSIDQRAEMLAEYKHPSLDTFIVFTSKRPTCMQTPDTENGIVSRTVMIPFYSMDGNLYVIGADLNRTYLRALIIKAVVGFFVILFLGIIIVLIITFYLSRKISKPIKELSDFTIKLADSNFDNAVKLPDGLLSGEFAAAEVQKLSGNIELMRQRLESYIQNLESATRERERVASELKIAGQIQQSFLPQNEYAQADAKIFAIQKSAKEAGGDLYDFFMLKDGRLCVAIGDVSGKGMPAAIFMARAMTLIRSTAQTTTSMRNMVEIINDQLCRNNDSCMFVTFLICAFDFKSREMSFVNCGHNPPLLRKKNGETKFLKFATNKILGVFENAKFEKDNMKIDEGDTLLFYTDGVTEAGAADSSFFGDAALEDLFRKSPHEDSPKKTAERIMQAVENFESGIEQSDDITIVCMKIGE